MEKEWFRMKLLREHQPGPGHSGVEQEGGSVMVGASLRVRAAASSHPSQPSNSVPLGDKYTNDTSFVKSKTKYINLHWQFLMFHLCRTEICI